MAITCKICSKEYPKQITNTHLNSHGITLAEYKEKYGNDSLSCPEYKKALSTSRSGKSNPNYGNKVSEQTKNKISESRRGIIPWNKGIKVESSEAYKNGIKKREEKYNNGTLIRHSTDHTPETKAKISVSIQQYAADNHTELSTRAKKAIQTKQQRGEDIAFFRGKKHTAETKKLISSSSIISNQTKTAEAKMRHEEFVASIGMSIVEESGLNYTLFCSVCKQKSIFHRQNLTESKFRNELCPVCYPRTINRSEKEKSLFDFVKTLAPDAIASYKYSPKSKQEIDIFVPSMNIGIEFNGLYWHSESVLKNKHKDNEKYNAITATGIKLIVVMEDEYDHSEEIVKSRLQHILKQSPNRIFARKCAVKEISSSDAASFCEKYHIQGKGRSNKRYGLFHDGQLISVMTFSTSNLSRKINDWELNRYCSVPDISIVGGASKLLKAFETECCPNSIVTYADRRWSDGNVYETLGFDFDSITSPGYWYFLPTEGKRIHRFTLRKTTNDDQTLTEYENRLKQGYLRIWDCGNKKYKKTY